MRFTNGSVVAATKIRGKFQPKLCGRERSRVQWQLSGTSNKRVMLRLIVLELLVPDLLRAWNGVKSECMQALEDGVQLAWTSCELLLGNSMRTQWVMFMFMHACLVLNQAVGTDGVVQQPRDSRVEWSALPRASIDPNGMRCHATTDDTSC